jgi:hypothetical protein
MVAISIAPAVAAADPIGENVGGPPGMPFADVTISGDTLTVTNATTDVAIFQFEGGLNSTTTRVTQAYGNFYYGCSAAKPGAELNRAFSCGDAAPRGVAPGKTVTVKLTYSPAGYTGGLRYFWVTNAVDIDCLPPVPGQFRQQGSMRSVPFASAAKLDDCDRQKLGVPAIGAQRAASTKLALTISGAPANWATRIFGASSRAGVKTATSGKTVTTLKPRPSGYPRGSGTFKVASSIKFVRAAWTKKGETPILGPISPVMK